MRYEIFTEAGLFHVGQDGVFDRPIVKWQSLEPWLCWSARLWSRNKARVLDERLFTRWEQWPEMIIGRPIWKYKNGTPKWELRCVYKGVVYAGPRITLMRAN